MPSHPDRVRRQYQHDFAGHRIGCPEKPNCTCSYRRRMDVIIKTMADEIDAKAIAYFNRNCYLPSLRIPPRESHAD